MPACAAIALVLAGCMGVQLEDPRGCPNFAVLPQAAALAIGGVEARLLKPEGVCTFTRDHVTLSARAWIDMRRDSAATTPPADVPAYDVPAYDVPAYDLIVSFVGPDGRVRGTERVALEAGFTGEGLEASIPVKAQLEVAVGQSEALALGNVYLALVAASPG